MKIFLEILITDITKNICKQQLSLLKPSPEVTQKSHSSANHENIIGPCSNQGNAKNCFNNFKTDSPVQESDFI